MIRSILTALVALTLSSCVDSGLHAGEGFIDVEGGRVWYRIAGSGDATPLLLLHGGPGVPSDYLEPLEGVAVDRPVIFYDQLGAGRSDRPANESLWTVERFVRELSQVRDALGLDEVHILGHSWGGTRVLPSPPVTPGSLATRAHGSVRESQRDRLRVDVGPE